ncbi:MAG: 6-carboxytetrahydropterin synthase QueD [candidate division FCPU426 bacterium]
MFTIAVEQDFSAAHQLREYQGQCEHFHGHNWKVRLEVTTPDLDELGLGIDFKDLKQALQQVLEKFDHSFLNSLPDFADINPTSENLARVIYRHCQQALEGSPVKMKAITVWESARAYVRYEE